MKHFSVVGILAIAYLLSSCGSSSSGAATESAPTGAGAATNGATTANSTAGTDPGDTVGNTEGSTTNGASTGNTSGNTDGSTTNGANTGDTSGNTDQATDTGETTSGGDADTTAGTGPDASVSLLDAGLSHAGTAISSIAETANDPQILSSGRDRAAALPNSPAIIFEVVRNQGTSAGLDCSALGAQYNSCSIVNLHIKDSDGSLDDSAWKLYFHSTRRILQMTSNEFNVTHVNGDLHYLSPNDQFTGFGGGVKSVKLVTEYNHLVETDFQPRYWIARGNNVDVIANTDDDTNESAYAMDIVGVNRLEFAGETNPIATPPLRFDRNSALVARTATIAADNIASRIVPKPTSMTQGAGVLDIGSGFSFAAMNLPAASIAALQSRQAQFMSTGAGVTLNSSVDATMQANTYSLSVTAAGIIIAASDQSMLFYAAQSLLALVQPGVGSIPFVDINDNPRFQFRGMHVDVARNFHSVQSMKNLIDQMSAYKLNKLHMHLSDDEGWRLEIPSLPELTAIGGKRGFSVDENGLATETNSLLPAMGSGPNSNNQGSGFYTRAQFIDLLQYANARYIEVIPEFDMPAHARAAVVAMRARARNLGDANNINVRLDDPNDTSTYLTVQNYNDSFINPCVPGTYTFLGNVVSDVKAMYTAANLPLDKWHMGGDEAINILLGAGIANPDTVNHDQPWAKSPVCNAFINNTASVNSREELTPYFVKQVAQIVADAGISTLYAYQDIYTNLAPGELNTTGAGIHHWVTLANANPANASNAIGSANEFASRGFDTVISAPDFLYFDFPYEVDPKERGYYWATRELNTEKLFKFTPENLAQNAATSLERYGNPWSASNQGNYQGYTGMQGFLWSETVRTPEQFDYMIYPRMLALAERAWHKASWELPVVGGEQFSAQSGQVDIDALNNDYATFALTLAKKELPKLDAAGISYRIPPPGAKVIGAVVQMNTAFPGLTLEYSTDGSSWQVWNSASPPASAAFVRSKSADESRVSRVTVLNN